MSDTAAEIIAGEIIGYCCETVIPSRKSEKLVLEGFKTEWGLMNFKLKRSELVFNDSIHGSIEINSLERTIINTLEFSRLKDIKQLGGKFYVYQGATHTRFEHSIGVCHLAGELIKHLRTQKSDRETAKKSTPPESSTIQSEDPDFISEEDELCVRLAGLCHDLGHGPFSHLFESVAVKILNFKQLIPEDIWHKEFLFEIVANKKSGMDVDKWDYFARDFLHLGATNEFDWRRCMLMSKIVKVKSEDDPNEYTYHIGFRDKEVANIYAMFRTRSVLYVKALYHKTVKAVEKMIADVFYFARSMKYEGGKTLEEALDDAYFKEPSDLSGYMALTDYFFYLIRYSGVEVSEDVDKAKDLIDRLRKRELYKMIDEELIIKDDDIMKEKTPEKRFKEMKKVIDEVKNASNAGIEELGSIELYCYKFTSEKSLNPVEKIYFYKKDFNEGDIPLGKHISDGIKDAPPLCKPEKLFEYRIRLYKHKNLEEEDEQSLKEIFRLCHADIKKRLKKIS